MAGLINSSVSGTTEQDLDGVKVNTANTMLVDPEKRAVATNETVAGQLGGLLNQESSYITRARTRAAQTANSRGLLNSSIAAGAGEAVAIDAALPIASQDAQTFTLASRDNQQAGNAALSQGASESNAAARMNADALNKPGTMKLGAELETGLIGTKLAAETSLQTLKGSQATGLANIEANYRQLLQASQSATGMYTTMASQIAAIQADTNTSAEQKAAAVQKITQMLEGGLAMIGSIADVDLTSLLDFS